MELLLHQQFRSRTIFFLLVSTIFWATVQSQCTQTCDSLASYYLWPGTNLTFISSLFSNNITNILSYNPNITSQDNIIAGERLNVPFSCGCINNQFMGHQFVYQVSPGDIYQRIATQYYSNLTTVEMLGRFNSYPADNIPDTASLNVTVNCSCGNSRVSRDYGLFITYPLRRGESLDGIASQIGLPANLLQDYNPGVDFSSGNGLVFVPGRGQNGTFPPLRSSSSGLSGGAIAGIAVGAVIGAAILAVCFYFVFYRRKKVTEESLMHDDHSMEIPLVSDKN